MQRHLLPLSIFLLAAAVASDRLFPVAHAQDAGGGIVCEEGFRGATGINRDKVQEFLSAQHAAGRRNFLPLGIQGSIGMICAW